METKTNTTNERKSFKEVLVENKGKLIVGGITLITTIGGACVAQSIKKNKLVDEVFKAQVDLNNLQGELNGKVLDAMGAMKDQLVLVKAIALEGALEEAINAVKKKIQYRVGKIDGCIKEGSPEALLSKEIYEKELEFFKNRLELLEAEWNKMIH